jgi:dipeptide/tripeptide permease
MSTPSSPVTDFIRSFTDLKRCPRGLWFVLFAFVVESIAYFGMLTLMTTYLTTDLGWSDTTAGITVSVFTMFVTLLMLGAGSYAEGFGLRRAIIFALVVSSIARAIYSYVGFLDTGWAIAVLVIVALGLVALGSAILQPVAYSGVKQYTDKKTNSMGYGLIYGFMNLGIVAIGAISAWARPGVERLQAGDAEAEAGALDGILEPLANVSSSGVQAVNWIATGITMFTLLGFVLMMTKKAEADKLRPDTADQVKDKAPFGQRVKAYFTEGPFTNSRFIFFIFMLLPVRTLFAHQWLTMPQYIIRAYPAGVGDKMEWLVNWINPLVIFIFVPILTALTRRVNVYRVMVIGSAISAAPTFLLIMGPDLRFLIAYFVIFSLGEALWSARFLEYASELAPEGRLAQYMGLANIPWLLAKGTTGFYSGYMLATYCPPDTPAEDLRTGTMWLIYACIAMVSPLGLWLARKWVMAGLESNPKKDGDEETDS